MALGLKLRKTPKDIINEKVNEAAKILQLEEYLNRLPKQLSGGQRQRVAIGRAITRDPKIFLFDEPLSNLDAKLRVEMRREIKKLHQDLQTTMVYVTHDQTEAMSLGTKIALMNNGKIEQFDTPSNIYNKPKSVFVADFVGSPPMNFIKGKIITDKNDLNFLAQNAKDNLKIKLNNQHTNIKTDDELLLGIRPEHIFFKKEHAVRTSKDDNFAEIKVTSELNEYVGHEQIVTFNYQGQEILGKFSSSIKVESGKEITLYIDLNNICFFDEEKKRV
jgi:multiple sugar transport system ATP-binding protein